MLRMIPGEDMKITFSFAEQPGDSQVESLTVRTKTEDAVEALSQACAFVQGVTTIPVTRVEIEKRRDHDRRNKA